MKVALVIRAARAAAERIAAFESLVSRLRNIMFLQREGTIDVAFRFLPNIGIADETTRWKVKSSKYKKKNSKREIKWNAIRKKFDKKLRSPS